MKVKTKLVEMSRDITAMFALEGAGPRACLEDIAECLVRELNRKVESADLERIGRYLMSVCRIAKRYEEGYRKALNMIDEGLYKSLKKQGGYEFISYLAMIEEKIAPDTLRNLRGLRDRIEEALYPGAFEEEGEVYLRE